MPVALGPFKFDSDADAWALNSVFKRDMDTVADVTFPKASGSTTTSFGDTDVTFTASAVAGNQVQLVWPDDEAALKELAPFGIQVAADEVGVRLRLHGRGEATAAANVPAGPLKVGLGLAGGGSVSYARFQKYPVTTAITDLLADTVKSLRLPVQATLPAARPAAGELLTTTLSGYLQVSADVAWGATLTGTRGVSLADLDVAFRAKLSLAATAAATYRLAGSFDISCCRADDRVRLVVRKSRESTFSFAADFSMVAAFKAIGLPKTADEFLESLLGADAGRALRALDRAQQLDSIDEVKAAVGTWAEDAVVDLAEPILGRALDLLDKDDVEAFLQGLREVTGIYTGLDERVAGLYQDAVDDIPALTKALDVLAQARDPKALKHVSDARAWTLFRKIAGDRLYDALLDVEQYKQILDVVDRTRDFVANGPERVKTVVVSLQQRLAVDPILRKLNALTTPDDLKALVKTETDPQVRKLVALLVDKSFARLQKLTRFENDFKALQRALKAVDEFKDRWYKRLLETANSSYQASLHAEFTRATADEALLDVEIDVATLEGQRLARRAALGDFSELLADARHPLVRLNDAVLTHRVTRQARLHVNVLGFEVSRLSRLVTASDDSFQQSDAGLLLVHTFEVKSEEERRVRDEQTTTRFLIRGAAEALVRDGDETRDLIVDTLRSLSAAYDFSIEDSMASAAELAEYLVFAQSIGLIDSPPQFVEELQQQLPDGWTKIKAAYVVRYDPIGVSAVFARETGELVDAASRRLRALIGRVMIAAGRIEEAKVGAAFIDAATRQRYADAGGPPAGAVSVVLPAWVTRDKAKRLQLDAGQKMLVFGLLQTEKQYRDRLERLDAAIDSISRDAGGSRQGIRTGLRTKDLDSLATDFVAFSQKLPRDKKVNPFFGTFDALVFESAPKARRAALVLEITPKGSDDVVTKYLSA